MSDEHYDPYSSLYSDQIDNIYYHQWLLRNEYSADTFGDPNTPWTTAKVIATVFKLLFMAVVGSYIWFKLNS